MTLWFTRDLRDGVVGAVHGGPGGAVDKEGQVALLLVLDDQLLQLLGDHLAPEHQQKVSDGILEWIIKSPRVTCGAYCKMLPPLHC